jgi:hypothetical protein
VVGRYTAGEAGAQFVFWAAVGAALIPVCLIEGARSAGPLLRDSADAQATDSLFLCGWLLLPLVFSTFSVPFQAARHFLPALPPLALLGVRYIAPSGAPLATPVRVLLGVLLVAQAGVAWSVARVDAEYADSYRDFARNARTRLPPDRAGAQVWFVGHWGWLHYAERAGFRQLHVRGPHPEAGDYLIEPAYVDKGRVLERVPGLKERLHKIDEVVYSTRWPLRTVHPSGAHFYALFSRRGRVPYRFETQAPLEVFELYEVR